MRGERRFYFELASHLSMTVKELLNKLDSEEITEWRLVFKQRSIEQEKAQGQHKKTRSRR